MNDRTEHASLAATGVLFGLVLAVGFLRAVERANRWLGAK